MEIFKYKADRLPIAIMSFYFLVDLAIYFSVENIYFLILWFLLGIWPKGNICAWNHHHQHCNTFKISWLNRVLEIMYGLQTGITGYTWVLHHNLGHHINYLDQHKDESRWMKKNKETMGRIRYSFEVAVTSYYRAFKVGSKYPRVQKYFVLMILTTLSVLIPLTFYKPMVALILFWLPMMVSLYLTADATYDHHNGLHTDEHTHASRNIIDSIWYNRLTGNLGYHTAHHMKFGVHWSKLPALHEKIKHLIPTHCYYRPMIGFQVLDWASATITGWLQSNKAVLE